MFYIFRVNTALAMLQINPLWIQPALRTAIQSTGKKIGLSPKSAAALLVLHLPMAKCPLQTDEVLAEWQARGKIDLGALRVLKARMQVGYGP